MLKLDRAIIFFCNNHSLSLDEFVNDACRVYLAMYPECQKIRRSKKMGRVMNFCRLGKSIYEKIL